MTFDNGLVFGGHICTGLVEPKLQKRLKVITKKEFSCYQSCCMLFLCYTCCADGLPKGGHGWKCQVELQHYRPFQ